ncbi:MAG: sigma-54-dependent Fis family transcriptional regulator [Acidobacteria bacterium]|nr:sigma-54-dependent Fis family transcriptional regulator [Acidobacteriota bacterium]
MIFLDEIANLSLAQQAKLLRVLQEREVRRVGEEAVRRLDIQVIAATNRDLRSEIRNGRFRRDLYYRLKAIEMRVPPLRERREDIILLAEWFLAKRVESEGLSKMLTAAARQCLLEYTYPGNVRELKNAIESAYYLAKDRWIDVSDLPAEFQASVGYQGDVDDPQTLFELVKEGKGTFEELIKRPFLERRITSSTVKQIIKSALRESCGRYKAAFKKLQICERDYGVTMVFLKRHNCYLDFRPFRRRVLSS